MTSPQRYRGQVVATAVVSQGIRSIKIRLIDPDALQFRPGQYLAMDVGPAEQAFYSIASSPSQPSQIELLVKEDPPARGASYMFALQVDDPVTFEAPMGEAYFREDGDNNLIFVAGSSGVSYTRCILHHLLERGELDRRSIHYFYGVRNEDEMIEVDDLHRLSETHDRFHFIPSLSGLSRWSGASGLITDVIDACLPNGLSGYDAYVAGSHAMVNATAHCLIDQKGLPSDRFFSDMYGTDL